MSGLPDRPVVIVTGSATGVGAATAVSAARSGARVVVNYSRNADAAAAVIERCHAVGGDAVALRADVAGPQAESLVEQAVDRWGRVDLLVNNAAAAASTNFADIDGLDLDEFRHVLEVNVVGAFRLSRACLPWLRRTRGAIVNVSSHVALTGGGSSIAYTASKGALNALTLALARIGAPEVRVNAVLPGVIDTGWMARAVGIDEARTAVHHAAERSPLGRVASAEDVADAVLWLGTRAAHTTGELVAVDGGARLMPMPRAGL